MASANRRSGLPAVVRRAARSFLMAARVSLVVVFSSRTTSVNWEGVDNDVDPVLRGGHAGIAWRSVDEVASGFRRESATGVTASGSGINVLGVRVRNRAVSPEPPPRSGAAAQLEKKWTNNELEELIQQHVRGDASHRRPLAHESTIKLTAEQWRQVVEEADPERGDPAKEH